MAGAAVRPCTIALKAVCLCHADSLKQALNLIGSSLCAVGGLPWTWSCMWLFRSLPVVIRRGSGVVSSGLPGSASLLPDPLARACVCVDSLAASCCPASFSLGPAFRRSKKARRRSRSPRRPAKNGEGGNAWRNIQPGGGGGVGRLGVWGVLAQIRFCFRPWGRRALKPVCVFRVGSPVYSSAEYYCVGCSAYHTRFGKTSKIQSKTTPMESLPKAQIIEVRPFSEQLHTEVQHMVSLQLRTQVSWRQPLCICSISCGPGSNALRGSRLPVHCWRSYGVFCKRVR